MKKVLVVDDDTMLRSLVADMIVAAGFEAVTIPTGRTALDVVSAGKFDVLVTDVIMPEVDGVELVQAARRANPSCAIIAMSGGAVSLPASVGLKLTEAFGADAVLYKPFTMQDLVGAIREVTSVRS